MNKDYEYNFEWDTQYCYPNSHTLKNKLNIADAKVLNNAEREISTLKIALLKEFPIKGNLDFHHLKDIHKYIFEDIYEWAGKPRTVNIAKGNQFCNCMYIDNYADDFFKKLKEEKYLLETPENKIPQRLAFYLSEINVLHPFREGNGRTQRALIEYLAQIAGYVVDFTDVTDIEMIESSAMAFACKYDKINKLFDRITSKISRDEQNEYAMKIINKESLIKFVRG